MRFHAKPWSQTIASRYVGIPFVPGGRDRAGLDCWGLVCLVYREAFGIEIDEGQVWTKVLVERDELITSVVCALDTPWRWVPLSNVETGDVLVFALQGHLGHVGLQLTADTMLHAHEGLGVTIDRWGSPTWRKRLRLSYRHRERTP